MAHEYFRLVFLHHNHLLRWLNDRRWNGWLFRTIAVLKPHSGVGWLLILLLYGKVLIVYLIAQMHCIHLVSGFSLTTILLLLFASWQLIRGEFRWIIIWESGLVVDCTLFVIISNFICCTCSWFHALHSTLLSIVFTTFGWLQVEKIFGSEPILVWLRGYGTMLTFLIFRIQVWVVHFLEVIIGKGWWDIIRLLSLVARRDIAASLRGHDDIGDWRAGHLV